MSAVTLARRMTAEEVAEATRVSPEAVRAAYRRGDLVGAPPRGLTRPVLFRVEAVERWLDGLPPEGSGA